MALIDFSGFEDHINDTLPHFFTATTLPLTYLDRNSDTPYNSGWSMQTYGSGNYLSKTLLTPVTTMIVGLHQKNYSGDGSNVFYIYFANVDYSSQITFYFRGDTGSVAVYRGTSNYTLLGESAGGFFNLLNWNFFEVKATASNTVGSFAVCVNGKQVLSVTGVDTLYSGSTENYNKFYLYGYSNRYDNIYVCDDSGSINNDFLGPIRVNTIKPSANGNQNDGVASAGSNYECVDEEQLNNDTDYVTLDALGEKELYALEDLPSTAGTKTIYGVKTVIVGRKTDLDAVSVSSLLRVNNTNYISSNYVPLSVDYVRHYALWELNPDDSQAWEEADINALEAGLQLIA